MEELPGQSLRALAAAIRDKEVSSVEVVTAYLARIESVNPAINAVVHLTAETALKRARMADADLARGELHGPLHGVPMTIKDSLDTTDAVTTWGTLGRKEVRPGADATCVARLRDAGAVLLGKTNTPEFTLSFETENLVYGATYNPYNTTYSPGGSSGGAAAIIAAGGSPLDIGTDTAGSIRLPAHFCGIAGLKPTTGRVPATGNALPASGLLAPLTQPGPMARYVDDLIYTLPIISGPDLVDQGTVSAVMGDPDDVDVSKLRFGFHSHNGVMSVAEETEAVVTSTVKLLDEDGHQLTESRPSGIEMAGLILGRLFAADGGQGVEVLLDDCRTETPSPAIEAYLRVRDAPQIDNREFAQLLVMWDNYRSSMLSYFIDHDVLICPVNASNPHLHGAGDGANGAIYTSAFNLAGWPGVVIRAGTTTDHMPIGVQILAAPWREDRALAVAAWLEERLGPFPAPDLAGQLA